MGYKSAVLPTAGLFGVVSLQNTRRWTSRLRHGRDGLSRGWWGLLRRWGLPSPTNHTKPSSRKNTAPPPLHLAPLQPPRKLVLVDWIAVSQSHRPIGKHMTEKWNYFKVRASFQNRFYVKVTKSVISTDSCWAFDWKLAPSPIFSWP